MTGDLPYSYWHRKFDSLIRYAAPELAALDRPLAIYETTVAITGIDPDEINWKGLAK